MHVLAIDPGSGVSGWVELREGNVIAHGIDDNELVLGYMSTTESLTCVIESPEAHPQQTSGGHSYLPRHIIPTVLYTGRLVQEWYNVRGELPHMLERRAVRKHCTGKATRVGDKEVRAAMIERFGGEHVVGRRAPKGKKLRGHEWAALALAVTFIDGRF